MKLKGSTPAALAALAAMTMPGAVGSVHAQDLQQASEGVEEIVVTARKREENLQDVPAAVSAFTDTQLSARAVTNLEDITALAPNVKVNAGRGTNSTITAYIRGVGQNDPLWGFEPGVGIYIDDVYIARPQGALLDVYDVERIEVLRGPQGTLYGKNTLAGAIKYVTRDIVGDPTLRASAAFGSYSQIDGKIGGSLPLGENVYLGAAVAKLTRDGYGSVVTDTAPYAFNNVGEDVSNKDVLAARVNATFVFGDSRLRLMGDHVQDDSNVRGGQRLNDALTPRLPDRYDVRSDVPVDQEDVGIGGASAIYTLPISDAWDLKAIAAYREGEVDTFIDFETLNTNRFNVPAHYEDDQVSGEVQLNFGGERVKAVGGLYYFDGDACGSFNVALGNLNLTSLTQGCVNTKSLAVYGDASIGIGERFNVNVGARWNEDDKEAQVYVAQHLGNLAGNQRLFDRNNLLPGFVRLGLPSSDYTEDRKFSDVSPRLGVDFHVNDDTMLYAMYSQGFKSGGFDMRGNAAAFPGTRDGYDSETVDNFEAGVKADLFDRKLRLATTVFHAKYEDVQITTQQFVLLNGVPTNVTAVLNAGKQTIEGVEFESTWRPLEPFTLTAAVGYLDATIDEFLAPDPANPGQTRDVSNLHSPLNAPDWTIGLDAMYEKEMFGGVGSLRLGYQFRDDTKVANTTRSVTDQPSYEVFDAGMAFITSEGRLRFALDGKNIFDAEYITAGYDFGNPGVGVLGGVSQIGYYAPPRTVTFTATLQF